MTNIVKENTTKEASFLTVLNYLKQSSFCVVEKKHKGFFLRTKDLESKETKPRLGWANSFKKGVEKEDGLEFVENFIDKHNEDWTW